MQPSPRFSLEKMAVFSETALSAPKLIALFTGAPVRAYISDHDKETT